MSFRVDVDPSGAHTFAPLEAHAAASARGASDAIPVAEPRAFASSLPSALAAARERGRLRAAEILSDPEMLSADAFAELLGTTRPTVNAKRQNGRLLGLDGAKRGFRFPTWQLDRDGRPYGELPALFERLGGAWAVYRFLVQPHAALGGLTGREALERGRSRQAIAAAESVARDFR